MKYLWHYTARSAQPAAVLFAWEGQTSLQDSTDQLSGGVQEGTQQVSRRAFKRLLRWRIQGPSPAPPREQTRCLGSKNTQIRWEPPCLRLETPREQLSQRGLYPLTKSTLHFVKPTAVASSLVFIVHPHSSQSTGRLPVRGHFYFYQGSMPVMKG